MVHWVYGFAWCIVAYFAGVAMADPEGAVWPHALAVGIILVAYVLGVLWKL